MVCSWRDRDYIRAGLAHWLALGIPITLLTVTEDSEPRGLTEASSALTRLLDLIGRRYKCHVAAQRLLGFSLAILERMPYVGVWEWHPRRTGVAHAYLLLAGVEYRRKTSLRKGYVYPGHSARSGWAGRPGLLMTKVEYGALLESTGFGPVHNARAVGVGQDPEQAAGAVSRYVADYLTVAEKGAPMVFFEGFWPIVFLRDYMGSDCRWLPGRSLSHGTAPPARTDSIAQSAGEIEAWLAAENLLAVELGATSLVGARSSR